MRPADVLPPPHACCVHNCRGLSIQKHTWQGWHTQLQKTILKICPQLTASRAWFACCTAAESQHVMMRAAELSKFQLKVTAWRYLTHHVHRRLAASVLENWTVMFRAYWKATWYGEREMQFSHCQDGLSLLNKSWTFDSGFLLLKSKLSYLTGVLAQSLTPKLQPESRCRREGWSSSSPHLVLAEMLITQGAHCLGDFLGWHRLFFGRKQASVVSCGCWLQEPTWSMQKRHSKTYFGQFITCIYHCLHWGCLPKLNNWM